MDLSVCDFTDTFTELFECVNEWRWIWYHSSDFIPTSFFILSSCRSQVKNRDTQLCNLIRWFWQRFECCKFFRVNHTQSFLSFKNLWFSLFKNFFSFFTLKLNFGTFNIKLFLFSNCSFLEFVSFLRSNFNLLKNGLNFYFFSIDFFLFNLQLVAQNSNCLFSLFEFLKTILITSNHFVKVFIVRFKRQLICFKEIEIILRSSKVFPFKFLFKLFWISLDRKMDVYDMVNNGRSMLFR